MQDPYNLPRMKANGKCVVIFLKIEMMVKIKSEYGNVITPLVDLQKCIPENKLM